jgi:hypothetical protein
MEKRNHSQRQNQYECRICDFLLLHSQANNKYLHAAPTLVVASQRGGIVPDSGSVLVVIFVLALIVIVAMIVIVSLMQAIVVVFRTRDHTEQSMLFVRNSGREEE